MARFPSPLIEPDVPISGIRLSDWFHRMARGRLSPASVLHGRCSERYLRHAIELPLKDPDPHRCCQAHRQSPDPLRLRKAHQKSGAFPPRSYPASSVLCPCPTPAAAAAHVGVRGRYPRRDGSPPLPGSPSRRAVPITPADRTGACVDCFPVRAAFPVTLAGRHPRLHFRGLLRLYSRYGPPGCSTACAAFVTRLRPSQLPGKAARQLPDLSTTIWVDSASTGYPCLSGHTA